MKSNYTTLRVKKYNLFHARGHFLDLGFKAIRNIAHHIYGKCNICGHRVVFVCTDPGSKRNNLNCPICTSNARKRHIVKALLDEFKQPSLEELRQHIYSLDAYDPIWKYSQKNPNFISSLCLDDVPSGKLIDERIFCQDVQKLTFKDESFDAVISEDVMEHVPFDQEGFLETYRVLKTSGVYIFTVPFRFNESTLVHIDPISKKQIGPPQLHCDRLRGHIAAYRSYGVDMLEMLKKIGFETRIERSDDRLHGIVNSHVFISRKS